MRVVVIGLCALCCVVPGDHVIAAPRNYPVRAEPAPVPKPSGPLELTYRLDATPRVGAAIDIEVVVRGASLETPRLEAVAGDAALAIIAQSAAVAIADGFRWSVTVVPLVPAAAYVTFVATARIDGIEQSRSVVAPIRTAAEFRAAQGAPVTVDSERLILLPAQEPATPR